MSNRRLRPCRMQLCGTFYVTLTLTDPALRKRPRRHPAVPATEAQLPEKRRQSHYVPEPEAAAGPRAVVEMSRAAPPRPQPSRKISCLYTQMGIHRGRPASVHVNQQVHLDLLPIRLTPPRKGRLFCRIADWKRKQKSVSLHSALARDRHGGAAEQYDEAEQHPLSDEKAPARQCRPVRIGDDDFPRSPQRRREPLAGVHAPAIAFHLDGHHGDRLSVALPPMGNGFTREAAKLGVKHDAFPPTRADDNWRTDGIAIRASLGSECEHDAGHLATCDMSRSNLPLDCAVRLRPSALCGARYRRRGKRVNNLLHRLRHWYQGCGRRAGLDRGNGRRDRAYDHRFRRRGSEIFAT